MNLPTTADIVIIGGGVMGASAAYHLAKGGVKNIVLLEKEEFFGTGAPGRCAGGVRYQFSTEINVRLSIESLPMIERFRDEIGQDVNYRKQIQKGSALFPKNSGAMIMPLQAGGCFYYQPDLRYPMGDLKETRQKYAAICVTLLKAGVMFPRPPALIAKQVAAAYPRYFKLLRSIKKAVDPNNIMNPGKLGL